MSRGLGHLQYAILATLDDAKKEQTVYTGRKDGDKLRSQGNDFDLPDSLQYLARAAAARWIRA